MVTARPLPGLPPYGPRTLSFPKPGAFREGFVVEFSPTEGEKWVGNFYRLLDQRPDSIHLELGSRAVLVVAGGAGYVIDAEARTMMWQSSGDIQHVWYQSELHALVVSNGLWFEAFDARKMLWRSLRISWNGVRALERTGLLLTGEAFNPSSNSWFPFSVNLANGRVSGGTYSGPPT